MRDGNDVREVHPWLAVRARLDLDVGLEHGANEVLRVSVLAGLEEVIATPCLEIADRLLDGLAVLAGLVRQAEVLAVDLGPGLVAALLDALRRDVALASVVALAVHAFRDPGDLEGLPAWVWRCPAAWCPALELVHVDSKDSHLIFSSC